MKRVPLNVALKPLLFISFVSGTYTLPVRIKSRKFLSTVRGLLNVLFASVCCFTLLVNVTTEVVFLLQEREGSTNIASYYRVCLKVGELYLAMVFPTMGSTSLRRFLSAFQSYRSDFSREDVRYLFIMGVGIYSFLGLLIPQMPLIFTAANGEDFPPDCHYGQHVHFPLSFLTCEPAFVSVTQHFSSGVFGTGFLIYLAVWRILMVEAKDIAECLRKQEKATLLENPERLEYFRLRHAEICDLIVKTNNCLRHIIAAYFGSGVPCILFVIHGFVYKQLSEEEFADMASFFSGLVVALTVMTLTGVALNLKMHEPAGLLFKLNIVKSTGKGSEVVAAFLSRLQGAPIGFNVYHLFTVDPSTILMLCGTILTYAVVIVQIQPKPGAGNSQTHPHTEVRNQSTGLLLSSFTSLNLNQSDM
ncbi:hypothetical protein BaRGS_00031118 [Batillaria attramentaria]|uniref:Gustatory receptor n=1 Tax=Batillaria attramentaria TaxID=370345 RepID=A0ABD0JSN1_9CAEN